jgi:hypothetical protein
LDGRSNAYVEAMNGLLQQTNPTCQYDLLHLPTRD